MDVHVRDFQSLADVDLKVEGLTVVLGSSNSGKSALIRAISSALFNRSGPNFVRTGETNAVVAITGAPTDQGREDRVIDIEWTKGKTPASYVIDGDREHPYQKVGKGTPDPVTEAGYRDVDLRDGDLRPQVASQHDPLFLLQGSGTLLVDALAAAARLDIFSLAVDLCGEDFRSAGVSYRTAAKRADEVHSAVSAVTPTAQTWLTEAKGLLAVQAEVYERRVSLYGAQGVASLLSHAIGVPRALPVPVAPDPDGLRRRVDVARRHHWTRKVSEPVSLPPLPDDTRLAAIRRAVQTRGQAITAQSAANEAINLRANAVLFTWMELDAFYKANPLCPTCGQEWKTA